MTETREPGKGQEMADVRVGVFTSKNRSGEVGSALGGYRLEMDHSQSPDFLARLAAWNEQGFGCAVVDEQTIGSKAKMVAEVAGACSRGEAPPVVVLASPNPRTAGTDPRNLRGLIGCTLVDAAEERDPMAALASAVSDAAAGGGPGAGGRKPAGQKKGGGRPAGKRRAEPSAGPKPITPPEPAVDRRREPPAAERPSGKAAGPRPQAPAPRRIVIDPERDTADAPPEEPPRRDPGEACAQGPARGLPPRPEPAAGEDPFEGVDGMFDEPPADPIPTVPLDAVSRTGRAQQTEAGGAARIGAAALRYHAAKGQTVIACCGTLHRSGCSNLAVAVARSLVLAGKSVAVCVSKVMFQSFANHYRGALSQDRLVCRINGISYIEAQTTAHPALTQYDAVVLDLGYVSFDPQDRDGLDAAAAFLRADLRLVQMPLGTVSEIHLAREWIRRQDPMNMDGYRIGLYSAPAEVVERFRGEIHMLSPEAFVWQESYCPWPVSATEVPPGIAEALEPAVRLTGPGGADGGEAGRKGLAARIAGLLGSGRGSR